MFTGSNWVLDKKSKTPIYLQISSFIKERIISGHLVPGTKLSQRSIALECNSSRKPVAEAFEMLESEGLVKSKPKSGTVVADNVWTLLNSDSTTSWYAHELSGRYKPSPKELFTVFEMMDEDISLKVNGDNIASSFSPQLVFIKSMEGVARRMQKSQDFSYFGRSGLPSLKVALSEHMKRYGIDAPPEQIIITSGVSESVSIVSSAFLGCGTNIFHETPSFVNSVMMMKSTGANMVNIPMDDEGINLQELIVKLRRAKNSILYMNTVNHNPTGVHISKKRRDAVLAACTELGVPIIENDMHRDFYFNKPFPRPLKAFDKNEKVVYIGHILGCFMGFKFSWIVAPRAVIQRLIDIRMSYELTSNILVEMFVEEMLRSGAYYDYLDYIRPLMLKQYNTIMKLMDKHLSDIAVWRKDNPSYFIWVKFNDGINIPKLYKQSKEYLFFPGVMFDLSDQSHVRLNTVGIDTEYLEDWIIKISLLVRG